MSQLVNTVVTNILTALYEPFWFAITMSVLFMFLYMHIVQRKREKALRGL